MSDVTTDHIAEVRCVLDDALEQAKAIEAEIRGCLDKEEISKLASSARGVFLMADALAIAICAIDKLPRHRRSLSDQFDMKRLLWASSRRLPPWRWRRRSRSPRSIGFCDASAGSSSSASFHSYAPRIGREALPGGHMSIFTIDREGLKKLIAKRGKGWILAELIQNAWDAEKASHVAVNLEPVDGRRAIARLTVEDDSPIGFRNLAHAYTLFAPSDKATNPRLRGRFNLGEKLVIAYAESASIVTTTGSVVFEGDKRRVGRRRRERGTLFEAVLPMTKDELDEALQFARRFISPEGVATVINEEALPRLTPIRRFDCPLQTIVADEESFLVKRVRTGTVRLYAKREGQAWLHEMGIPVVELGDDKFDIDIDQRVPLGWERDNVPPAWLRALRTEALNHTCDLLDADDAASAATTSALAGASHDAVRHVIQTRFPNAVSYDLSDPEANSAATANGMHIVHGGTFNRPTWDAIRAAQALEPAGRFYPSPKPFAEEGEPVRTVPPTPAMEAFRRLAEDLALALTGHSVAVAFCERFNDDRIAACYARASRELSFNMRRLGKRWFEGPLRQEHLDLLLHELGHDAASDHLSADYHRALTRFGAGLTLLALERPAMFQLASLGQAEAA
jgi:hypothetical protein